MQTTIFVIGSVAIVHISIGFDTIESPKMNNYEIFRYKLYQ